MKTNMLTLSSLVKWSVCGDGYVGYSTHNKNAHYSVSRAPEHRDYIEYIYSYLLNVPDCSVRVDEYTRNDNGKTVVDLRTSSHPLFTRIRERQYISNHKVIDPHMLTLLNWEWMALWYQDDGSITYNQKGIPIVKLSTCAYSYPEQEFLRKAIYEKLNIVFNINRSSRGLYQLNLRRADQNHFFSHLHSFVMPSYYYKCPLSL